MTESKIQSNIVAGTYCSGFASGCTFTKTELLKMILGQAWSRVKPRSVLWCQALEILRGQKIKLNQTVSKIKLFLKKENLA